MTNPREVLRDCYGFALPESFFRFWDFVQTLPEGEKALKETLHLGLAAPFDALRGKYDPKTYDPLGAARHFSDPPEFFALFYGTGDGETTGIRMGYWVSEVMADHPDYPVAYHYRDDGFEINAAGDDILMAMRLWLELEYDEAGYPVEDEEDADYDQDNEYWARKTHLDDLRERLRHVMGDDREERGYDYIDLYSYDIYLPSNVRTLDGAGLLVPKASYRRVSYDRGYLSMSLFTWETAHKYHAEGHTALREGFPGSALKIGRDLWCFPSYFDMATDLMMGAYAALGREVHRWVVAQHCRRHALVDVPAFWQAVKADEPPTELDLGSEHLGVLSPEIEQLPHLEALRLPANHLTDLPDELAALTNLHTLTLPNNDLGKLPSVIMQMKNLRTLDISQNVLVSLPPQMADMNALEDLSMGHASLTVMPSAICDIPNLKTLRLRGGTLAEIPACIGKLKTLDLLDVYNLQPLEAVAAEISECEALREITYACYVNGSALPEVFCGVSSLKALRFYGNDVAPLSDAFDGLTSLEELSLVARGLHLPPSLFRLPKLKKLYISDYAFSELSPEIGQLSTLEELHLNTSILQALPEEITQLSNLKRLHLQRSSHITDEYLDELRAKLSWVEVTV